MTYVEKSFMLLSSLLSVASLSSVQAESSNLGTATMIDSLNIPSALTQTVEDLDIQLVSGKSGLAGLTVMYSPSFGSDWLSWQRRVSTHLSLVTPVFTSFELGGKVINLHMSFYIQAPGCLVIKYDELASSIKEESKKEATKAKDAAKASPVAAEPALGAEATDEERTVWNAKDAARKAAEAEAATAAAAASTKAQAAVTEAEAEFAKEGQQPWNFWEFKAALTASTTFVVFNKAVALLGKLGLAAVIDNKELGKIQPAFFAELSLLTSVFGRFLGGFTLQGKFGTARQGIEFGFTGVYAI